MFDVNLTIKRIITVSEQILTDLGHQGIDHLSVNLCSPALCWCNLQNMAYREAFLVALQLRQLD